MEFGKIDNPHLVDFTLPPDAEANTRLLQEQGEPNSLRIYMGCTGWGMPEWVGKWYPKGTKSKDYLMQYALQFNSIELNTTHYRIPDAATTKAWYEATPQYFRFPPKVPQTISRSNDLGLSEGLIPIFCQAVSALNDKLGTSFLQLPPYFGPNRIAVLERFLQAFPVKDVPLAIEFRHEDWFSTPQASTQVFNLLERYGVSTVITDVAGRRDVLHQHLTTPTAMLRFVGTAIHDIDYPRLMAWIEKLSVWKTQGLREAYIFIHEPDNTLAPELATYFATQGLSLDEQLIIPKRYDLLQPIQGTLF